MTRSEPLFDVTHIFFDVDGTLVDFVGAMRAGLHAAAEHASDSTATPITSEHLLESHRLVSADSDWVGQSWGAMRRESFRRVVAETRSTDADAEAVADELIRTYYEARLRAMTVYPDVEEALGALQERGLTMIAASNGNVELQSVGLDRYFVGTHYASEVGVAKPDPKFFSLAAETHSVHPASALVVGDRIDNDYEPARAAGMHAVLIDRSIHSADAAVLRIERLTEVVELVVPGAR